MTIIPEEIEIFKPDKNLENIIQTTKVKEKLLYKKQSDFHNIFVVQNKAGRFVKFNDTYQAGIFDTKYYKGNIPYINYFLIPCLINKNIEKILFMGFGTGYVLNQYEILLDKLKAVDIVDIEENIFPIAEMYFDFKVSSKMNFYLQDAIVYLKSTKKKYDLIVSDVANNTGIDDRFISLDYIEQIKLHLKKGGIFISNLPSSRDLFNKKNKILLNTLKKYESFFKYINIYNGEQSNRIYYKTFFDLDKPVYDITNAIILSSDKKLDIKNDVKIFDKINLDITKYLDDLIVYKS